MATIIEKQRLEGPILVGCEESQVITQTFRRQNYEAYSCDLKPTRGDSSIHYQDDVRNIIPTRRWSLIILHPECTALSLSGNKHYGPGKPLHHKRLEAIEFTLNLWKLSLSYTNKLALENPLSVIFKYFSNVQYVQPFQFGHEEKKKTGFALHNLVPLKPTHHVSEFEQLGMRERIFKMPDTPARKRERSVTFQGIADAIVNQWGVKRVVKRV